MCCDCLFQEQMDRIAQVLQWWNGEQQSAVQEISKGKRRGKKSIFLLVCFCFVLCIDNIDVYVVSGFHQMHSLLSASIGC